VLDLGWLRDELELIDADHVCVWVVKLHGERVNVLVLVDNRELEEG